jgi:hypothetical protein
LQKKTILNVFNYYLRNKSIKDSIIENYIQTFYDIISKSPSFNNEYYVYRLVNKDDYLLDLKIGDIYEDKSFISTSRNPFYNPKNKTEIFNIAY